MADHVPALDGLRGLAVAAVLVAHAGPPSWAPGGFLGVSLFFTLSGYLIGSLVLAEVERSGGVSLAPFWSRRIRRLLPALVLTTLGVVLLSRLIALPDSTRSELLGGLGYVANWVQLGSGRSYAELFEAPSAVTHLWSLAIEEQFYLVFPLVVWWFARRAPAGLRRGFVIGGLGAVVVGVAATRLVGDAAFAYYGTPARAPEIAVGTVLAGLWPLGTGAGWGAGRRRTLVTAVGAAAMVLSLAAWRTTDLSDGWVSGGGLAAFALVSGALVLAACAPGPVSSALSVGPLAALGRISYGLYLYHWPVVVLLSQPRVDLGPVALFVARTALSLALAVASYLLVEQPIRRGRVAPSAPPWAVIAAGTATLVVSAVVVVVAARGTSVEPPPRRPAPAVVRPGAPTAPSSTSPGPTSPAEPAEPEVPVVAVLGDSVPNWLVRDGGWSLDPAEVVLVDGTSEGCDGAEGAPVGRAGTGVVVSVPETCTGWRSQYPAVVEATEVDVAALVVGTGAVLDRRLDGEFHGPCSEVARRWYHDELVARLRYLGEHVDEVVLVLPAWAEDWSGWVNPPDHRERTDCVRDTMRAAAAEASTPAGEVRIEDLGAHLCPEGPGSCRPLRSSDGVHLDAAEAPGVLSWLVAEALDDGSGDDAGG